MISKETIKKLADLARIEIKEEEQEELAKEIEAILGYVGQVKSIQGFHPDQVLPTVDNEEGLGSGVNIMREDTDPTESGTHSKELVAEFPDSENGYLKVKKILQ